MGGLSSWHTFNPAQAECSVVTLSPSPPPDRTPNPNSKLNPNPNPNPKPQGKYDPISSRYLSAQLVDLVGQLLTHDSNQRPSIKQLLCMPFV